MLQRFSRHRRVFDRDLLDPPSWALPTNRQGSANSVPRVRCDDHTREARDTEWKGLPTTLQTSTDQPGRDRTAFPGRSVASNPLTRVSATLSRTLSETLQLQVRHYVRGLENASLLATRERREHRNNTLLRGLLTLC